MTAREVGEQILLQDLMLSLQTQCRVEQIGCWKSRFVHSRRRHRSLRSPLSESKSKMMTKHASPLPQCLGHHSHITFFVRLKRQKIHPDSGEVPVVRKSVLLDESRRLSPSRTRSSMDYSTVCFRLHVCILIMLLPIVFLSISERINFNFAI